MEHGDQWVNFGVGEYIRKYCMKNWLFSMELFGYIVFNHKTLKLETYAIRLLKLHLCGHLKKKYKQNQSFFFSASTFTIFTINISHFVYKKKHKTKTFFPPLVAVCVYIFVHIITNIQNGCPPSIKKTFKSVTF